jgi:hypothetical protein
MPRRAISCGVSRVSSPPSKSIDPRVGLMKPMAAFISVLLPMPFLPSSATASPCRTSSVMPKRMGVLP